MNVKGSCLLFFLLVLYFGAVGAQDTNTTPWPTINSTTRPWARWWWMGSAVDKQNLRSSLLDFHRAGIGGVEITPIYGVKGEEANYIDFLSPKWMEMLQYTLSVADSLGMQVDMVLGTGWPYGGPQVDPSHAATKLVVRKYTVHAKETFEGSFQTDDSKEKIPATLLHVVAYGADGSFYDLTDRLQGKHLKWTATDTTYDLYAIFSGKTGQMVKRAAPGGNGFTVDHYSKTALKAYVSPFNTAFNDLDGGVRAIFNDSYEVYGTDFTPTFLAEFEQRRGYDIKAHLPELLSQEDNEMGNRIKSDYRETLSELLLYNFDVPWTQWANDKGIKTRLQAHGSPGNLIDLYASADIPECETFGSMPYDIPGLRREEQDIREGDADPVMLKFSSSAAHIAGKGLVSSESFTWLRDHFKTALSQTKPEAEDLLLSGINHLFLHGSTYSPERAVWPGWKFYASVNFNATNPIWEDAPALFSYITNCQSILQEGRPDNETLVYWPIYDIWGKHLKGSLFFQFKIHSLSEWLHGTPFYETTRKLMDKGYAVDFISDSFIERARCENGRVVLPGGSYASLVVPDSDKMPLSTLEKLLMLKKEGAHIIFEGLPETVPGFNRHKERESKMTTLIADNKDFLKPVTNVLGAMEDAGIAPETLVDMGLKYIRREVDGEKSYYLVNHTAHEISGWVPLQTKNREVLILDPLTMEYGGAAVKKQGGLTLVKLRMAPGKALFLKTQKTVSQKKWKYYRKEGTPMMLDDKWQLSYDKGGPNLPPNVDLSHLGSWTELGPEAAAFSGTATYTTSFKLPQGNVDRWKLRLGDVRESAEVWLNGAYVGTAWSVPFELELDNLKKGKNTLSIKVTNLGANRIRDLELRGREWKIFHEINMVDKDYKKFDATKWQPMPSGLLGPVSLVPMKLEE